MLKTMALPKNIRKELDLNKKGINTATKKSRIGFFGVVLKSLERQTCKSYKNGIKVILKNGFVRKPQRLPP